MQWTEPIAQAYDREVMRDHAVFYAPRFSARPPGAASDQLVDQSGNRNNGTFSGGYTLGQPGPFPGSRAALLDGASGFVDCGTAVPDTSYLTVSGWCRPASLSGYSYLATRDTFSGAARCWVLGQGNPVQSQQQWYAVVWNAAGSLVEVYGGTAAVGRWTHLALTYDGVTVRLYANGLLVASAALSGTLRGGGVPVNLGRQGNATSYFAGSVAAVEICGSALPPARVPARYAVAAGLRRARRAYSISGVKPWLLTPSTSYLVGAA